jgi:hypothetical protein
MKSKVYKIEPLVNNSFYETFVELISYLKTEYPIRNVEYIISRIYPDSISFLDYNGTTYIKERPKHLFLTINHVEPTSWTNKGGHSFCKCILDDNSKLLINYDTSTDSRICYDVDNKFLRRIKLKKISESNVQFFSMFTEHEQ